MIVLFGSEKLAARELTMGLSARKDKKIGSTGTNTGLDAHQMAENHLHGN
ncbi:hypothetical protein [Bacillus salipaludis]|nr:hypothetical protein [Bacillus salipaludis]